MPLHNSFYLRKVEDRPRLPHRFIPALCKDLSSQRLQTKHRVGQVPITAAAVIRLRGIAGQPA